jgi:alpha-L-rhamnosidase
MFSQRTGNNGQPLRWFNLGDWAPASQLPPDDLVHTFYLWRCADYTAKTAKVLGYENEAREFENLAEKTKAAFGNKFWDESKGTYGAYGANIFALRMGVPKEREAKVIEALRSDIKANDGHLDTGIFGTQFFFEVLTEYGMHDLAYEAMNKRTMPSYGWWIEQGATTTWEHWNGSSSRNHPMFGGGLVWFYRKLAGMSTDEKLPGYRNIIFHPQPAGDVNFVTYSNLTPYGNAGIRWEKNNGQFIMDVTVPVGSTAVVFVPANDLKTIRESGEKISTKSKEIVYMGMDGDYALYTVRSGEYHFVSESDI